MAIEENREGNVVELKLNFNTDNTLTEDALNEFADVLQKYSKDEKLKVLILSSASSNYFSNGLDPNLFVGADEETVKEKFRMIGRSSNALMFFPVPVIMMIEGHCMAMGAAYAISCDYRFMADGAGRIGFPEALISMLFPVLPTVMLKEIVGLNNAKQLLYSGRAVKAKDAHDIGLVDEVYAAADIKQKTWAFAQRLEKHTREALSGIKQSMRAYPYQHAIDTTGDWDLEQIGRTVASDNAQEGFKSILEKRRPVFKD